jgi:regulator of sirC expression with transglutaminase-like and TPR domain
MVSPSPGEATWSLERFASLANASEAELPLFKTALLISAIQYPNLPNGWWQEAEHRFEELLDETRHDWGGLAADSEAETLANYAAYFAGRLGFQGDRENYHQPDNSCLLKVMERRRGLPIALAVLFVEIGRRAGGLELFGVGAPGHFLAGGMAEGEMRFVDVFGGGGEAMRAEQAAWCVSMQSGRPPDGIYQFLRPATGRDTLLRMLNNLKAVYSQLGDAERLVRTLTWILVLRPDDAEERRNRGLLLLRLGRHRDGARDLLRYLESSPEADDVELIRREAERALGHRTNLN